MEDNFIFETTPVQPAPHFSFDMPKEQSSSIKFDSPKEQSSIIKVIGVGGGGGNAVNHMFRQGIEGVDFIVCNTDMKALNDSPVPNKISLGNLGAGNKPERACKAAQDKADDIREVLSHNTKMLFITAGMGGGTGTGAAPVIAEIAKSIDLDDDDTKKILVVAIVTLPFSFEGRKRREQALAGIKELSQHVDSIIVINNDKLRTYGDLDIDEAFGMADDVLLTAAKGIAEIITVTAKVNIDFQDVNTVMENSGTALMGAGSGSGENRALQAIEGATTSVLLDDSDIRGAKNVLLYFSYSSDHKIRMDEIGDITDFISEKTDGMANVIWGAGIDDSLGDSLKVTLIATGFEKSNNKSSNEPKVIELPKDEKPEPQKVETKAPEAFIEPVIIHKEPEQITPNSELSTPNFTEESVVEEKPVKVVHPLYDEPVATVKPATEEEFQTELNTMVDNIRIVHQPEATTQHSTLSTPIFNEEPVAVVEPEPIIQHSEISTPSLKESPARSAFANDELAAAAAERIRKIHEMLRNDPTGPDKVQSMTTQQIAGEMIFEGISSAAREASTYTISQNGTMMTKPSLHDNVD